MLSARCLPPATQPKAPSDLASSRERQCISNGGGKAARVVNFVCAGHSILSAMLGLVGFSLFWPALLTIVSHARAGANGVHLMDFGIVSVQAPTWYIGAALVPKVHVGRS